MRFAMSLLFSFIISVLGLNGAFAATQFKTFKAAMAALNDYDPADNELQIKSEKPLSFMLVQLADPKDSAVLKMEYAQLVFIYGIYRAFCHLNVQEISITSTVGYGYPPAKRRPDPVFMMQAKITRSQAMTALTQVFPAASGCDDIIVAADAGGVSWADSWRDEFSVFKSKKANQDRLIGALRAQGVKIH